MPDDPRILILVVAYEGESTLARVLARIPVGVLDRNAEVLVIDDSSGDDTFASGVHRSGSSHHRIRVLTTRESQGYGGNQKLGYQYAIAHRFDFVLLLHGDGRYAPEAIPALLAPLIEGSADCVLGSRMLPGAASRGGVPLSKRLGNRILNSIQNRLLGSSLSELHSGFRAYRVAALERIPFAYDTNKDHFDTEIIIQLMLAGQRIEEVPIPPSSGDEISRVDGIRSARDVLRTTLASRLQAFNILYDRRFDVGRQDNAHYGLKLGYSSSHTRALEAVAVGSRVLDIGCGPGSFAELLVAKGCRVTGIDQFPPAEGRLFEDFLIWDESLPFPDVDLASYDFVLLLDVIEHLRRPEELLDQLRRAASDAERPPTFIVTSGNVAFLPVRLQALLGNFNYGKRGILDLTHTRLYTFASLRKLFEQCGYRVLEAAGIPAPFPLALGRGRLSRTLLWLNEILIRIGKRLFAYQIFLVSEPTPSLEALLDDSIATSRLRTSELITRSTG